jgi:predicted aspartyl protease
MKNAVLLLLLLLSQTAIAQTEPSLHVDPQSNLHNALIKQGYSAVSLHQATKEDLLLVNSNLKFGTGASLPFLIDTGASTTAIDQQIVKIMGLKLENNSIVMGGSDSVRHRVYKVIIPLLRLDNNFTSHDVPAYAADESHKKFNNQAIVGVLGLDYFRRYQSILDIKNQYLYLKADSVKLSNEQTTAYRQTLIRLGYQPIPLIRTPSGHIVLRAQINDASPVLFLLDCGSPYSILSLDYVKKLDLKLDHKIVVDESSGGGEVQIFQTHIKNLVVGSTTWLPKHIAGMDFSYVKVGVPLSGVIGLDWMRAHQAVIDLFDNVLFVKVSTSGARYYSRMK